MNRTPLLKIEQLSKSFPGQAEDARVLNHIDLTIDKKEFLCILGPSGCGKTTLLRCIAGFEKYEGRILVNDEIRDMPGTDRIMVFQDFNQLFPWKTVEANIQYPLKVNGIRDRDRRKAISDAALQKVQLTGYERYYPYQLSGGMKQRVAIAKALALKPQIILMDEPFAALDAMTRRDLQNELLRIAAEEASTFIFVTHNIQEALILGKRILVLTKEGRIVYDEKNRADYAQDYAHKEEDSVVQIYRNANITGGKAFEEIIFPYDSEMTILGKPVRMDLGDASRYNIMRDWLFNQSRHTSFASHQRSMQLFDAIHTLTAKLHNTGRHMGCDRVPLDW